MPTRYSFENKWIALKWQTNELLDAQILFIIQLVTLHEFSWNKYLPKFSTIMYLWPLYIYYLEYALMSTELWAFDNPPQHLNESMLLHLSQHEVKTSYSENDVVFRQSYDYCLKNLMNQCFIPNKCLRLINNYDHGGYIITHQILYLHIARQLLHLV